MKQNIFFTCGFILAVGSFFALILVGMISRYFDVVNIELNLSQNIRLWERAHSYHIFASIILILGIAIGVIMAMKHYPKK